MEGIVPVKHQHKVFDNLIQAALESVKKEGEVSKGGSHSPNTLSIEDTVELLNSYSLNKI